jgi:hypothetical protein
LWSVLFGTTSCHGLKGETNEKQTSTENQGSSVALDTVAGIGSRGAFSVSNRPCGVDMQ